MNHQNYYNGAVFSEHTIFRKQMEFNKIYAYKVSWNVIKHKWCYKIIRSVFV